MSVHASSVEILPILANTPPLPPCDEATPSRNADDKSGMAMPRDWQSFALTAILVLLVSGHPVLQRRSRAADPVCVLAESAAPTGDERAIKVHVPKTIAALFIVLLLIGTVTGIGSSLSGPAAAWIAKAP